jgi:hypothetical protein
MIKDVKDLLQKQVKAFDKAKTTNNKLKQGQSELTGQVKTPSTPPLKQ